MRTAAIVLGFLGAGLVGGFAARYPARDDALPPKAPDRLGARVEELAGEVARLSAEVRRISEAPPPAAPAAAPAADAPSAMPPPVLDVDIEAKVRATVEDIAREEQEARAKRELADTLVAEDKWIAGVREPLGLSDAQVEGLRSLLARRREGIAEYKRRLAERGADITPAEREVLTQEMKDLGIALDQELRAILSPAQYDAMMALKGAKKTDAGR